MPGSSRRATRRRLTHPGKPEGNADHYVITQTNHADSHGSKLVCWLPRRIPTTADAPAMSKSPISAPGAGDRHTYRPPTVQVLNRWPASRRGPGAHVCSLCSRSDGAVVSQFATARSSFRIPRAPRTQPVFELLLYRAIGSLGSRSRVLYSQPVGFGTDAIASSYRSASHASGPRCDATVRWDTTG